MCDSRIWIVLLALVLVGAQPDRKQQYLGLARETLRHPITHEELRNAILSPAGVASIQALFEQSIAESLVTDETVVTPELGGESTLASGKLTLVSYPDPVHPILRGMIERKREPARLLQFLESTADGRKVLQGTGGLHALLYQMSRGTPTSQQEVLLDRILVSAVATFFKTWTADPEIQARMIETTDWSGRYVGFWHIHPPRLSAAGFRPGIEPSLEDMRNAIELGQFLTFVFQPDGFDAYDLAPLGQSGTASLALARVVRYRSPEWKPHFEAVVRSKRGG
jgi:hypothetical protein